MEQKDGKSVVKRSKNFSVVTTMKDNLTKIVKSLDQKIPYLTYRYFSLIMRV